MLIGIEIIYHRFEFRRENFAMRTQPFPTYHDKNRTPSVSTFLRPVSKITLPPSGKKVHLCFFALRALQFWEMTLFFFYFYLGKIGFNIFPDLKSKQIKF